MEFRRGYVECLNSRIKTPKVIFNLFRTRKNSFWQWRFDAAAYFF